MTTDFEQRIAWLEAQWDPVAGALGQLRYGDVDWNKLELFIATVRSWERELRSGELLPQRFVALLWSVPQFVDSHRARILDKGVDPGRVDQLGAAVFDAVSTVLGLP